VKQAYVCVVTLLLDVDDEHQGADALSAILTEERQMYHPESALLDWTFIKKLAPVEIRDDFEPDYSKYLIIHLYR
jgi:hypothetical protein